MINISHAHQTAIKTAIDAGAVDADILNDAQAEILKVRHDRSVGRTLTCVMMWCAGIRTSTYGFLFVLVVFVLVLIFRSTFSR